MDGTPPVAPSTAGTPLVAPPDKLDLARRALVPLVPNAGPRCPRCGTKLLTPDTKSCPRCGVDPGSAEAAALLVPEGKPVRELLRGASYVPRGFVKILTTPRLWGVSALPLILNVIIMAVVIAGGIWLLNHALKPITETDSLPTWTGWWLIPKYIIKFTANLVSWIGFVMVPLLTAWLMSAFPFSIVLRAIFMPFSTIVGERTEQIALSLPQANQPFHFGELQASITLSIVNTILLALVQGVLYIVLIPIALIPPIWMVLPPAIMSGMDHTDPTFCRKNYYMRERVALWRTRKWRFLGFGLTFFFLLGIPIVNAIIFPTVAAGAALLYIELDRK